MYKAQISDGEQIQCTDYENGEFGVRLFDDDRQFLAFVPYSHLLYVGSVDQNGRTIW